MNIAYASETINSEVLVDLALILGTDKISLIGRTINGKLNVFMSLVTFVKAFQFKEEQLGRGLNVWVSNI